MRRLLPLLALLVAVGLVAACEPQSYSDFNDPCPWDTSDSFLSEQRRYFYQRLNTTREIHNVPPVPCNGLSNGKAQGHAEDMAMKGLLYHSKLEGGYPLDYWCWLGEDVGVADYNDKSSIYQAWLASPTHLDVIVDSDMTHVGIGWASGGGRVYAAIEGLRPNLNGGNCP